MKSRFAPSELSELYILIVDSEIIALADQAFNYFDHGTFTEVVRSRL